MLAASPAGGTHAILVRRVRTLVGHMASVAHLRYAAGMRLLALAVALGACGPGLRSSTNVQADPSQTLVAAISQRDVAAIEQQLATPLAYGGMYFADAECMRTFPTPGVSRHRSGSRSRSASRRC